MMADTEKEFNSCSDVILHLLKLYEANRNGSGPSLQAADDEQEEWSRILSNAAGYVVRETRTGKRMVVSFRDAELCNVAIANMYELQFLSAIDALPALLASDIPFRAISTETAEKLERGGYMEKLDILYDTRSLGLFAPTANPGKRAYIGDISNKKAAAVHKLVLCEESRKALGKLLSPDSPMRNFFDMSCNIAEEIANELFCGNARVSLAGKKTKPMASIASRFDLMPTTSPKIREETRVLNLISDAGDVWAGYIGMLGEDSLLTAVEDPKRDGMWSLPSIGTIRSWFRSFREISGVETGVKALFDGVPVEDIVV